MAFSPLSVADTARLDSDRALVRAMQADHGAAVPGAGLPGWQLVLDGRLGGPVDEAALEAFGTILGDALCGSMGLRWVRVDDEYGSALGLRLGETSITVFPRDMVVKRVERDEHPDLQHLHDGVVEAVGQMEASGEHT